ncbi:SLC13 family permease [Roseibium salinum]|uniref:DASS family sodium-coupled anion symporter n=1 Tax=Roseibium salinum TaxID=1604349 RepID=A0ABT3R4T8_9HYPH|nr:DASS family sodium-coupled anion symporter [Roseibium sp. DSM 29163]MCX2724287.1 DASS family sodium-coupled anion symporter [Roseibium sp. DSM 29163]
MVQQTSESAAGARARRFGLVGGALLAVAMLALPAPEGLSQAGWATAAVGILMAIWWMSEAVPLAATALVPLVLFPLLGIESFEDTAGSYANPLIFLFLGGFILARGLERWQLHRRLAVKVLKRAGGNPLAILAGIMAITAFLSMWVSNTATAMVMLPIAQSVVASLIQADRDDRYGIARNFAPALMLAVAYSATIGGMGTLIGTPPNALFAGFLQESYGITIGFAAWMLVGVPAVLVLLPVTFLILSRVAFKVPSTLPPVSEAPQGSDLGALPPMIRQEWTVAGVMTVVALLWLTRPLLGDLFPGLPLSDAGIAMTGALALFVLPDDWSRGTHLLGWDDLKTLRWDVLILFGGGLALAGAIGSSGLSDWIGTALSVLAVLPASLLVLTVMVVIVYLGELASNTAMAAVFLPVAASAAIGMGAGPLELALPVVLAASLGFMLPVATPPNAIVYGSGAVTSKDMLRAGAILDVVAILITFAVAATIGRWVFLA